MRMINARVRKLEEASRSAREAGQMYTAADLEPLTDDELDRLEAIVLRIIKIAGTDEGEPIMLPGHMTLSEVIVLEASDPDHFYKSLLLAVTNGK